MIRIERADIGTAAQPRGTYRARALRQYRPHRREGAGKTGRRLAPAAPVREKMHGAGTTGSAETHPAFPAQWLERLTPSSPRGPGSFAPVIGKARVARLCGLSASVGAPGPHGLTVREAIVRPHSLMKCCDRSRPPLSRLHVRDDRETPLCTRRVAARMRLISAIRQADYFPREIWTGVIGLKARAKLVFRRTRLRRRISCRRANKNG